MVHVIRESIGVDGGLGGLGGVVSGFHFFLLSGAVCASLFFDVGHHPIFFSERFVFLSL